MMWPWECLWYTLIILFEMFLEYPITLLGLLGIPCGIYCYFIMYPEDWQKIIVFLKGKNKLGGE